VGPAQGQPAVPAAGRESLRALSFSILDQARARPDAVALIAPEGTFTYRELLDASARVAAALLGDRADLSEARVAVLVAPGFEWMAAVLGIWQAGGMVVPLALAAPAPELQQTLEDAAPELVIAEPAYLARIEAPAEALGIAVRDVASLLAPSRRASAPLPDTAPKHAPTQLPDVAPERAALMLYTSGTTGRPKGVVHTHASLAAQVRSLHEAWRWRASDHVLLVLPLHHVHGIVNVLLCALGAGARCTIHHKFDARTTWKSFHKDRLTLFMAVPTIYTKLLAELEAVDERTRFSWQAGAVELRLFVSGSAALPVSVMEDWERLTGHRLLERYGMTEIGMALSNPLAGDRVPGHVGRPLPGVEVRVTDDAGAPLPAGTPGELQVRGPTLFREYWKRPEETAASFTDDGWFKTGDETVETPSGFRILGRRSVDILKSGGEKLSALEIEEMFRTHPDVADIAVVGVPDEKWGERVCAAILARPDTAPDPAALRKWASERLAPWKVPREVRVVDELPRNALGKVVKPEVRRIFG
jgi:malonyl-CoA/methylmalonyl-CoA synthetase